MENIVASAWFLPVAGLLAGCVLGFVARNQRFCTMSALERYWYANDSTGLRTWILAAATALVLTQSFQALGLAASDESFYIRSSFAWTGAILGGVMFGFGMALVGTCGFGALVRLGGGSLRSLVVLIILGVSALSAQKGLIAQARVPIVDNLAIDFGFAGGQSIGLVASYFIGVDLRLPIAGIVALAMFGWVFRDSDYRRRWWSIGAGMIIGAVITFGWVATTLASRNSFEIVQLEAGSFVVPVGDALLQLMTFTGSVPDYGVGLVMGVIVGSAINAQVRRTVRWEACDDARELSRHLLGALLMGVGGVFAMGCTIGQGITGVSALAISAPLAFASIALGAKIGLAYLIEGSGLAIFRESSVSLDR
ncbi:YeeE/YedE family protein [Neorhizobium petrolearium]|uniref:YeeE/YedE family protein n=1 Tax=Neorhizobium petrolearium TaxID=515361 RepID=UPI003F821CEA